MKTHTPTIEDRPTGVRGLVAKYKIFREKPAWIKTRRFFWAVGVVLWKDVFLRASSAAGRVETDDVDPHTGYSRDDYYTYHPYGHHPTTGEPMRDSSEDIDGIPL